MKTYDFYLIKNGKKFIESMISTINSAQEFVCLHTYILTIDEITGPIITALDNKAKHGIPVYLICDSFGSSSLSQDEIEVLESKKFHFSFYQSVLQGNHIGRRLHQKVLLVDNQQSILGGINLSKEMNLPESGKPWLDYAICLKGSICQNVFVQIYPIYKKVFKQDKAFFYKLLKRSKRTHHSDIKIIVNDWMRYKNEIYNSYFKAIKAAQTEITLMATYFVPGKKILKELKKAAQRGVKINLIFCSHSDLPLISKIEEYLYGWYLKHNFCLYDWKHSVMHGKVGVIDNRWCTVGSYNHNFMSHYGNLEINAQVTKENFIHELNHDLKDIMNNSTQITSASYHINNHYINRFLTSFSYVIANLVTVFFMILISRQSEENHSI